MGLERNLDHIWYKVYSGLIFGRSITRYTMQKINNNNSNEDDDSRMHNIPWLSYLVLLLPRIYFSRCLKSLSIYNLHSRLMSPPLHLINFALDILPQLPAMIIKFRIITLCVFDWGEWNGMSKIIEKQWSLEGSFFFRKMSLWERMEHSFSNGEF